jgi:uncharacterized protein (TIGR02453 family)
MAAMAFPGWPAEAVTFFEGLEADNSKAYWQAHRQVYDGAVRRPMELLLAELTAEFGEGRIFRPYRDVRFSADKSPYKTAIGAALARCGYVQFSADGLAAGCGDYQMSPERLDRYRRAVTDDDTGAELARILDDVRRHGIEVTAHDRLKTMPRGYPKDSPRADLLRLKGLITWQEWPVEAAQDRGAKRLLATFFRRSAPVQQWLRERVGEPG